MSLKYQMICSLSQPLIITSESTCNKLLLNGWKSITVNEGLCNSMTNDLAISNNHCLKSIVLKKNSLKNLNSLVISNDPQLSSIVTEDGSGGYSTGSSNTGVGYYMKHMELSCLF